MAGCAKGSHCQGDSMNTAARIIQAAGWTVVAVLYVAACILLLPVLAVSSWYGTRPARCRDW